MRTIRYICHIDVRSSYSFMSTDPRLFHDLSSSPMNTFFFVHSLYRLIGSCLKNCVSRTSNCSPVTRPPALPLFFYIACTCPSNLIILFGNRRASVAPGFYLLHSLFTESGLEHWLPMAATHFQVCAKSGIT